jgi:hypothetical protein
VKSRELPSLMAAAWRVAAVALKISNRSSAA